MASGGSIRLDIRADVSQVRSFLRDVLPKDIRAVTPQAINFAARNVRRKTIDYIAREKRVKRSVLSSRISIEQRATVRKPSARIRGNFAPISYPQLGNVAQTKRGARVPRKGVISGSFLATMPSGHFGVFKRRTRRRLPIQEQRVVLQPEARLEMERLSKDPARELFVREFEVRLRKRLQSREAKAATAARGGAR